MDIGNSDSGPSYMSFLSRYSNNGANQGSAAPTSALSRINSTTKTAVAPKSANPQLNNKLASPTTTKPASIAPGTSALKRKAEEELARQGKINEGVKNVAGISTSGRPSANKAGVGTVDRRGPDSAKLVEPEPTKAPKKGSYLELLQRAKTMSTTQRPPVGTIVNKPRPPPEKKEKEWQKKIAEERAAKAKSPGAASSGEKTAAKVAVNKGEPNKKTAPDAGVALKKGPVNGAPIRKASVPAAAAGPSKLSKPEPKARMEVAPKDRERLAPKRPKFEEREPTKRAPRYVYREDSYDSESDMEAAGLDILEEEERSYRVAKKEDLEQELLEKRLAAEKAARRKSLK